LTFATDPDKRSELWKARHNAWYAAQGLKPGSKVRTNPSSYTRNQCSYNDAFSSLRFTDSYIWVIWVIWK